MDQLAISIPQNLATGTVQVAGAQIVQFQTYILMIGGVMLAAVLIEILINAIRPK